MTLERSDEELVSRLPFERRAIHGVPAPDTLARHEAALTVVQEVLGPFLRPGGVRVSPLGPGWSRDLDLHVTEPPPASLLLDNGWLPLDGLLHRLGSRGEGRWGIVADRVVLAGADITTGTVPDPLASLLRRAERRAEVRLREVLELRVLQRLGWVLPPHDHVVQAAAALESALGGDELQRFVQPGSSWRPWGPIPISGGARTAVGRKVAGLRPARRVVVGVSGVDGSGKSSLTRRLADDLVAAGVPASVLWTRPGMRLKTLAATARVAHRVFRLGPAPSVRSVAGGESDLASRRGALGRLWAVCVSVAFALDVRRRHAKSRGVVLYDRHLLDALVTLDFVYDGVDLGVARWIVRRAVPRAVFCLYVDVPAEVALERKPGDTFGEHAIRRQLEYYAARRGEFPDLVVLDGRRSLDELRMEALRHLAGVGQTSETPAGA
jgi:thymidylate kinase